MIYLKKKWLKYNYADISLCPLYLINQMLFANESLLRKITIECHKVVPRFNAKTSLLAFKATSSDAYVILIEILKKILKSIRKYVFYA